jgi:hypothetical protein
MAQQDVQGTTKYIQINERASDPEKWNEVNRALRYTWEQLANLKGSLGVPIITSDLDLGGHKAINAADPTAAKDLITKEYGDATYVAKTTSVNPGPTGTPADNPGTSGGSGGSGPTVGTASSSLQLVRWDTVTTLGSARIRDDNTYIIVGTGTTDAAVTSNALIVGSSANAGDLLVVRVGINSEAIRLLPGTGGNLIKSDITGAGTYRDLVIHTNNTEAFRINTGGDATAIRDVIANQFLRFKSGTLFRGTLQHGNTGNRGYNFPDETCDLAYKTSAALTANALVIGASGGGSNTGRLDVLASLGTTTTVLHGNAAGAPTWSAVALAADVSGVLPLGNGGTGGTTAATARASLVVPTAGVGAPGTYTFGTHTVVVNADGQITSVT